MSRASIHFEDSPDGQILMRVDLVNGYDPKAESHKLAAAVLGWLDDQAVKKTIIAPPPPDEPSAFSKGNGSLLIR